ncbi:unnamed protein product [Alopecurus aequalis]
MNLLSYAMEDLLDCVMTKTPLDIVDSEAAGFLSPAWRFAKRMAKPRSIQIRKKIRQLKRRSEEARASFDRFVVNHKQDAPTASTEDEASAAATHVTKESQLLQHLLCAPSESEKNLKVISIVGYGALGNTLLVNQVYNTDQVQNRFSRRSRYNAAGKEAGLVIKEISAQVSPNQNGRSTTNMEHHEIQSTPVEDLMRKAVVKHQEMESIPVTDLKGKAIVEDQETGSTSLTGYSGSSQKDGRYQAEGIDIGERDCELRRSLEIFINHHAVHVSENGEVKRCQFPVMMLNHISCESNSSNFLTSSCGSMDRPTSDLGNPVRRLSLHQIIGEDDTLSLPDASVYRHLRTLAVFHTGSIDNISKLSRYRLLRVLDMKECPVILTNNQLKKICNLLLLKYLSLGDTIDQVPREIAKLQLLQTLAMTKKKTVCVPVEVMELPQLKHLLGKFQLYKRDITKRKLKQLLKTPSQLQSLSGFVIGHSKEFGQLMSRMKKLRKVKIWCDAGKLTGIVIDTINKFSKEVLAGIRSLSIECNEYPSEIVKCLEQHGFLTSLKLRGDLKTHLDVQVDRPIIGLQGIKVLCLSETNLSGHEIVRLVTLFRSLEYLKLVEDNLGELKIPAGCLYTLRRLCLVAVSKLDRIIISEDSVLCFLVSLHMFVNTQCDLSGIDIDKLKKLEEITLYSDVAGQREWQRKASSSINNLKVLFIQRPN